MGRAFGDAAQKLDLGMLPVFSSGLHRYNY